MQMRILVAAVISLLAGVAPASLRAQNVEELKAMLGTNQAFDLRDAVSHGHAPAFYRGAVEDSENREAAAKRDLEKTFRANPHSEESFEAHEMLANMGFRDGRYHDALLEAEAAHAVRPDEEDLKNELPLFHALAESQDMQVVERRSSHLAMSQDSGGSRGLPIAIDGKEVTYGFDSGAALSVMGRSDAKLLGLEIRHVETQLSEASGKAIPGFDIAFASDLVIAGLHLKNVAFFVLQDTGEPWATVPVGSRGLIGMPVLLAMQTVRWQHGAWLEFGQGARPKPAIPLNMLFHGTTAIVQLHVQGTPLTFSLDTGAADTDLNQGFAKALPDLVRAGTKETRAITGMGGSAQYDSVLLGPVAFDLGGKTITLPAPHVFPAHSLGKFDGNLGNDILDQAKVVTLDFKTMTLTLE
jgi:predicted aspartyl protease